MPISRSDKSSSHLTKSSRNSRLDKTAFISDESLSLEATDFQKAPSATNISNPSTASSSRTEPLSELSPNSPLRTVSTAPAPTDHPAPRPLEDFSNDISNLL